MGIAQSGNRSNDIRPELWQYLSPAAARIFGDSPYPSPQP